MMFHVGEESSIKRFEPRPSKFTEYPVVWATPSDKPSCTGRTEGVTAVAYPVRRCLTRLSMHRSLEDLHAKAHTAAAAPSRGGGNSQDLMIEGLRIRPKEELL